MNTIRRVVCDFCGLETPLYQHRYKKQVSINMSLPCVKCGQTNIIDIKFIKNDCEGILNDTIDYYQNLKVDEKSSNHN